ncbi:hypothetical protein LSAT2_025777, partial [Lamellibrachia satsuma]
PSQISWGATHEDFVRYGEEKLAVLLDHFTDADTIIDTKLEWIAMRGLLLQAGKKALSQEAFYAQLIYPALDSFPTLWKIATI